MLVKTKNSQVSSRTHGKYFNLIKMLFQINYEISKCSLQIEVSSDVHDQDEENVKVSNC